MSLFGSYIQESSEENIVEVIMSEIPLLDDEFITEDMIVRDNLPGHIKGTNTVKIEVYTNEGDNVPHFHIENGQGFSCCPKLYSAEYFDHGWHTDMLNKKQSKFIDRLLRKSFGKDRTVWQECVRVWCKYPQNLGYDPRATDEENAINMAKYPLPPASSQPDYTTLNSIDEEDQNNKNSKGAKKK